MKALIDQNLSNNTETIKQSPLRRLFQRKKDSSDPEITTIPIGTHEDVWGVPVCLRGLLASVLVLHDTISPSQVKALYTAGEVKVTSHYSLTTTYSLPLNSRHWRKVKFLFMRQFFWSLNGNLHFVFLGPNHPIFFSEEEFPDFADLPSKAVVYYNAKVHTVTVHVSCKCQHYWVIFIFSLLLKDNNSEAFLQSSWYLL